MASEKNPEVPFESIKRLGRSAYQVAVNGQVRVRKYQPPVGGAAAMISRLIFGGSLPFRNERRVMRILSEHAFGWLRYPRPLDMDAKDYVDYEYVSGEDVRCATGCDQERIINSLLEFGALGSKHRLAGFEGFVLGLLESPTIRTLRWVLKSDLPPAMKWAACRVLLGKAVSDRTKQKVLLHNDLMFSNVRRGLSGDIYFVDFEDAIPESRFLLADAVDLLLRWDDCSMDMKALRHYWDALTSRLGRIGSETEFKHQVRLGLLRLTAAGRQRAASTPEQRSSMDALFRTIVDDGAYDNWYAGQCARSESR